MNLAIISNVRFEGTVGELDPLLDDLADVLSLHGFGNDVEDDHAPVKSIIIVRQNEYDGPPENYIKSLMEDSLQVVLPTLKEVEHERTRNGDAGDTEGDGQRDAAGADRVEGLQPHPGEGVRQSAD